MSNPRLNQVNAIVNRLGLKMPDRTLSKSSQQPPPQHQTPQPQQPPQPLLQQQQPNNTKVKITPNNLNEIYNKLHKSSPLYKPQVSDNINTKEIEIEREIEREKEIKTETKKPINNKPKKPEVRR